MITLIKLAPDEEQKKYYKEFIQSLSTKGDLNSIKYLVNKLQNKYNMKIILDTKVANEAVKNGHLSVLKYLVEELDTYPSITGMDLYYSRDAFRCAAENGHLDVLKYLFNYKWKSGCSYSPSSLVFIAAYNDHLDIVKYLRDVAFNAY